MFMWLAQDNAMINVQKKFQTASLDGLRSVHAVKGVSLRMAQSQCFSLLGHNGAGGHDVAAAFSRVVCALCLPARVAVLGRVSGQRL